MYLRAILVVLFSASLMLGSETNLKVPAGFAPVPAPEHNPLTPEKIALGKRLFFDPLLSIDNTVACANCHRPEYAFTVPERFGKGIKGILTPRRPATLLNRAYGDLHFWDGRSASLEDLALRPIQHPEEMGLSLEELQRRLHNHAEYPALFQKTFGRPPNSGDVALALAAFLRTLVSGPSALDRFLSGDARALSPAARRGFELFRGKARCITCHWEPNFSDEEFHNTGIAARQPVFDKGRGGGAFKTPTLHGVPLRPPYMHDGSIPSLEEVVEFYNRGGEPNPHLDGAVRPLQLTPEEKAELVAFLKSL